MQVAFCNVFIILWLWLSVLSATQKSWEISSLFLHIPTPNSLAVSPQEFDHICEY